MPRLGNAMSRILPPCGRPRSRNSTRPFQVAMPRPRGDSAATGPLTTSDAASGRRQKLHQHHLLSRRVDVPVQAPVWAPRSLPRERRVEKCRTARWPTRAEHHTPPRRRARTDRGAGMGRPPTSASSTGPSSNSSAGRPWPPPELDVCIPALTGAHLRGGSAMRGRRAAMRCDRSWLSRRRSA